MRRFAVVPLCLLTLAGCSSSFPPGSPTASTLLRGDYRTVADCGYVELSRKYPSLRQTARDAAKRIDVSRDVDGAAIWSISFVDAGGGLTKIEVRGRASVKDDKADVRQIADQVAYCGRRIEGDVNAPR